MSERTQAAVPPASAEMAARLTANHAGRLTSAQRRLALIAGLGALVVFLCPLAMLAQMGALLLWGDAPVSTLAGVLFTIVGALFVVLFAGLVGVNALTFLPEAFMRQPVRFARGPLQIRITEGHRPELPFSYIISDYSFAPYVAPADVPMRVGAPYVVYYAARSRLLLSLAALDARDGAQWEPAEDAGERPGET